MASVWHNILQLPVQAREWTESDQPKPARPAAAERGRSDHRCLGNLVALTGSKTLAAKCTAIMHRCQPEELSVDEVRDGWGELANMVGRHVQALVPPVSSLSLPAVDQNTTFTYGEGAGAR
jgi:hypothetical protein